MTQASLSGFASRDDQDLSELTDAEPEGYVAVEQAASGFESWPARRTAGQGESETC